MSDFRAKGTIIGPTGLTAVFGMGTGVAPPVWSPGNRCGGDQADAAGGSNGCSPASEQANSKSGSKIQMIVGCVVNHRGLLASRRPR
jgi:hypothetical protein